MKAWIRLMTGMATLAVVIPAVAMVVSEGISPQGALVPESASEIHESGSLSASKSTGEEKTKHEATTQSEAEGSSAVEEPPSTVVRQVSPSEAPDENESPSAEKDHQHDQSAPETSAAVTGDAPTSGDITGDVCPCNVRGKATLRGKVQLRGDLIVDGGELIARPGVEVDGNGFQIMFMNGGRADFQGTPTSTWSGTGGNANLTRDVVFRRLSRIMFHNGAGPSVLRYVLVTDTGVSEQLGFYPLHWHMNGNSTRGTIVEGVVVRNSPNHAFVPHGSHGITFKDTIAANIVREAYWWDPGDQTHNVTYDHALAIGVHYPRSLGNLGLFHRMSAFHLGRGEGNVVRNSVARDTSGGQDCSGFHWPEKDHGVWGFQNNASYGSACHSLFVWQNDSLPHEIRGFAGSRIEHGAYLNRFKYLDLDVDRVVVHALGRDGGNVIFEGGSVNQVILVKHNLSGEPVVFRNLSIGSVVVNNATQGGTVPGTYRFDNANLSCAKVTFEAVVPGTKVVIDGKQC